MNEQLKTIKARREWEKKQGLKEDFSNEKWMLMLGDCFGGIAHSLVYDDDTADVCDGLVELAVTTITFLECIERRKGVTQ